MNATATPANLPAVGDIISIEGSMYKVEAVDLTAANSNINGMLARQKQSAQVAMLAVRKPRGRVSFAASVRANGFVHILTKL